MIFDRKRQLNWQNHPFDICLNQERLVAWIRAGEGWGNCVKYLKGGATEKRGWNRKEGKGNKDFKEGGKRGQRVGALKRRRGWNPLTNYDSLMVEMTLGMYSRNTSRF